MVDACSSLVSSGLVVGDDDEDVAHSPCSLIAPLASGSTDTPTRIAGETRYGRLLYGMQAGLLSGFAKSTWGDACKESQFTHHLQKVFNVRQDLAMIESDDDLMQKVDGLSQALQNAKTFLKYHRNLQKVRVLTLLKCLCIELGLGKFVRWMDQLS